MSIQTSHKATQLSCLLHGGEAMEQKLPEDIEMAWLNSGAVFMAWIARVEAKAFHYLHIVMSLAASFNDACNQ